MESVSVLDTKTKIKNFYIPCSYFSSNEMDSKVIQYLPTSGKGHGILYVNQYSKQTRLFNPNSAITESGKAEDKCMPESFTETAMEGT